MTATAEERCVRCDRVDCDGKAATIAYGRDPSDMNLDRHSAASDACMKHRQDWREKARSAEAKVEAGRLREEALQTRLGAAEALLRESLDDVHEDRADSLHDRIRAHLKEAP